MKQFFQILSLGFFSVFLVSCGSDETDNTEQSNIENIDQIDQEFFLDLPLDWRTFPKDQYPRNVVFSAREPSQSNAVDTIIVVSKENDIPDSLQDFVARSLENVRRDSQDFQKLSEKNISLPSGEKAVMVSYTDRNSIDMSALGFYSLYTISKKNAESSVVSILYDPLTSDGHKDFLKNILKSYNPLGASVR